MLSKHLHHTVHLIIATLIIIVLVGCGSSAITPSPTVEPRETLELNEIPITNPTETAGSVQDGEILEDGWIRYAIPNSRLTMELPQTMEVVDRTAGDKDLAEAQTVEEFPEFADREDEIEVVQDGERFYAVDKSSGTNAVLFVTRTGNVPLQIVVEPAIRQYPQLMGLEEIPDIDYYTHQEYEVARVFYSTLLENGVVVRGEQFFLMIDGDFHVITLAYPQNLGDNWQSITNEIFERVTISP